MQNLAIEIDLNRLGYANILYTRMGLAGETTRLNQIVRTTALTLASGPGMEELILKLRRQEEVAAMSPEWVEYILDPFTLMRGKHQRCSGGGLSVTYAEWLLKELYGTLESNLKFPRGP